MKPRIKPSRMWIATDSHGNALLHTAAKSRADCVDRLTGIERGQDAEADAIRDSYYRRYRRAGGLIQKAVVMDPRPRQYEVFTEGE